MNSDLSCSVLLGIILLKLCFTDSRLETMGAGDLITWLWVFKWYYSLFNFNLARRLIFYFLFMGKDSHKASTVTLWNLQILQDSGLLMRHLLWNRTRVFGLVFPSSFILWDVPSFLIFFVKWHIHEAWAFRWDGLVKYLTFSLFKWYALQIFLQTFLCLRDAFFDNFLGPSTNPIT